MDIFTEQCCEILPAFTLHEEKTINLLKKVFPEGIPGEADCGDDPFSQMWMWCKKCSKSSAAFHRMNVATGRRYFEKDRQKEVASKSEDECYVSDSK